MITHNESTGTVVAATVPLYIFGLTHGLQHLARGSYSLDAGRHLAASYGHDAASSGQIIDGYADADEQGDDS